MSLTQQPQRAPKRNRILLGCVAVSLVVVACFVYGLSLPRLPASPPRFVTVTPAPAPTDVLTAIARAAAGDGLINASMDGMTATILFSPTLAIDADSLVFQGTTGLRKLAPTIFAQTLARALVVDFHSEFVNITGHVADETAMRFTLTRALNDTIAWDNFNIGNLETLAAVATDGSAVYVHPALRAAWAAYRARR
jgi:hypothetical protein